MTTPATLKVIETDLDAIATAKGRVAVVIPSDGKMSAPARRLNRLTKGALARFVESEAFEKLTEGTAMDLAFPVGLAAEALQVVKLPRSANTELARKAGAAIGGALNKKDTLVLVGPTKRASEVALGALLKAYAFTDHKSEGPATEVPTVTFAVTKVDEIDTAGVTALAEGVFFTRDLVSEPANVLTTTEFAKRLKDLESLGVDVEVLDEDALEALGMRTLLAVGQGSRSPSKVVVMQWKGGKDEAPLALVGKGVVFDTGGISIKPAGGMEDMTMDMGGAGVVSGVMKTLALRKAPANVVGLVGIVENMPDGNAIRPGDVIKTMKGDTVEIINTDAEGRMVLCDVMWYAQERFDPRGMIDLATLTGAIIVGLGHENAGVFSNDDTFCKAFLKSAEKESEGAWRMPLGQAYDNQLKSNIADMKNVGTRAGGSITAAQYLQRFVKEGTPWIHLDIAGVASVKEPTDLAPKGATGWGVLALNRLVDDLMPVDTTSADEA
ncbi:leucyl aminopeptidase [Pacificibacter marinus]|uniref:Probable cytosol aminopeptidase n=1 Tax=Pacificibacter marinus TaxID=658057 RepID=A0A1Y5RPS7_9RHOB|nr:leucyl aminopeptidase [Pacificibacter marinus]SEL31653.1 leucyl aminopeptidase [Pacificibacter marinus]SLN22559.1 Cytosol aminopeptidase [Pacificibacter marinus]